MVLLHLMLDSDVPINVLHCHFGLREEAVKETQLVADFCDKKKLPLRTAYFPAFQLEEGQNIQEQCRKLRYQWFSKQINDQPDEWIVTAHHRRDNIESFIFKLSRGAGLRGLSVMKRKNPPIYRPLLSVPFSEIQDYALKHQVPFLEDASNLKIDYDRNYIRHKVFPIIEKRFPSFLNKTADSISHLQEVDAYLQSELAKFKHNHLSEKSSLIVAEGLAQVPALLIKLYLQELGFNQTQQLQIIEALDKPGKTFQTEFSELITTSEGFEFRKQAETSIKNKIKVNEADLVLHHEEVKKPETFPLPEFEIYVDKTKLIWPISLRKWKAGDRMQPLGMNNGSKKIQDVLTDKKIGGFIKSEQYVVVNGDDEIIWLVGHAVSEKFKVSPHAETCLRFTIGDI